MSSVSQDTSQSKSASFSIVLLMLISVLSAGLSTVQAVGPNQNDLGSGGDLPDNTTVNITNYIFSGSYSGSGELDYGDDNDIIRVALNANQGLSASLSFPSTTTFSNGTTVMNDFDLIFYDANLTYLGESWMNNPETLTTNNTQPHGGMVYIDIFRYDGAGTWNLTLNKFAVSNGSTGGNGTGGGGGSSVTNCSGNGTNAPDILEPNDSMTAATSASLLPLFCSGLSIDSTSDEDFYEIDMISGVTYYVNLTFTHSNGDIDGQWMDSSGTSLGLSGSLGSGTDNEAASYTATSNFTSYLRVYFYQFSTWTSPVYDIELSTNLPGGGQSMESVYVNIVNDTDAMLTFSGLTAGTTYGYNHTYGQVDLNESWTWATSTNGTFNATNTTHTMNISIQAAPAEGELLVFASLFDAVGVTLDTDYDELEFVMVEGSVTSSTTGEYFLTNLSIGTDYAVEWMVLDYVLFMNNVSSGSNVSDGINASLVDSNQSSFTATTSSESVQVTWTGPTTLNQHLFVVALHLNNTVIDYETSENITGDFFEDFYPQLPALLINGYSTSVNATTNYVGAEGMDLVVGDDYKYQYRVTDSGNANVAVSSMTSFTASAQNMSISMFNYTTPTSSGNYCLHVDLYSDVNVQLIGDTVCIMFTFDDDNDGVQNEYDLCPNTASGAFVDLDGCALSQKDTDGDGYNDAVDAFPYDATQYSDMDGDGYGDNATGNNPDAFPTDATQWSDADGDGYGDNASGNSPDAFPFDPTQWSDTDGDGYGDNASGNSPDAWPADSTQWADSDGDGFGDNPSGTNGDAFPTDSTQWADSDGDGYGDNPAGTTPDVFPNDATQWEDADQDGHGDNPSGYLGDHFPNDASQWSDTDGDGYGDNQAGTTPDAFPSDSTQWSDSDGDGYGDNAAGMNPDAFPTDATQWMDEDNDGFGDNANGNNGDQCLDTPNGEIVDENGCSASQLDEDLDGVSDANDACPGTPAGESVDTVGCSTSQEDSDNDGVMDAFDACPNTPLGSDIDSAGCADSQLDSDGDSISDDIDDCPTTAPGQIVNGVGCSADERDSDNDGIDDAADVCDYTPAGENADDKGCSDSQKDDDGDLVYNDIDSCPGTPNEALVDAIGCADSQLDNDNDGISNAADTCPVTPAGEQVDPDGCSDSQKDEDMDDIWNSQDLCPDTPVTQTVDSDGCSDQQKDDDNDGIKNHLDDCPNTSTDELIDATGCALSQLDSDGDGVSDAEDAFKFDANETADTDGDGVADRWDAYPADATRSAADVEDSGNAMLYLIVTIVLLALTGGAGFVFMRKDTDANISPFMEVSTNDAATDQNMGENFSKELPTLQGAGPQQWEENGVHWSRDTNDQLSYYDGSTATWVAYKND